MDYHILPHMVSLSRSLQGSKEHGRVVLIGGPFQGEGQRLGRFDVVSGPGTVTPTHMRGRRWVTVVYTHVCPKPGMRILEK